MTEITEHMLPVSGLAEDILSRFVREAQSEADRNFTATENTEGETFFHLVTFHLAGEEYGVEIGSIQEIIRATAITPVPGARTHVKGVINLRGRIIPIIDLRKRFGLPGVATSDARRIVVVELGEKRLGMLVDSVSQVIKVPAAVVEEVPEEATNNDDYVQGVGKLDNRLVILLNLNRSLLAA